MALVRNLFRSLRGPRHHLEAGEKEWIERRLLWLREQFGLQPLIRMPLDPASPTLPRQWDGSHEAAKGLFWTLCEFMQVKPSRVKVEFYSESETHEFESAYAGERHSSGPAGLYMPPDNRGKLVIALEELGLADPASLAGTICHELAHVHLLADCRITNEEEDCEPLTDLLTVYFGAGIFTANSAIRFQQWQDHSHQGWNVRAQGYLPERVWGYALAGYAWMRGEQRAGWSRHLRANIRYFFEDASHFLCKTNDTTLPLNVN